jgi:hypothetical protein
VIRSPRIGQNNPGGLGGVREGQVNERQRLTELNAARRRRRSIELRQHLINASNELYLHEMLCAEHQHPFPPALRRARSSIRAELRRLEAAD